MAQQHLRNILACLDMPTLGQPEAFIQARDGLFDEAGNIGADSKEFLQNWMDQYIAWVKCTLPGSVNKTETKNELNHDERRDTDIL